VWTIGQDKFGFMWIGTANGLNRYDGHSIKKYFNDPSDSTSLPGNTAFWIHTDREGDMWIALGTKGVVRYNYQRDCFDKLPAYEKATRKSQFGSPVWRVGEDQRGRIYLACGGACYRYTKSSRKFEDLTPLFKGRIDQYGVAMFVQQGKDVLWILTDNGLFRQDLNTDVIEPIPFDAEKLGYGLAAMHDAEFINGEEMLITMGRPGFVLFNTRTRIFSPAPAPFNPAISKTFTECGGVIRDRKGRIWLSNSTYGLMQYYPEQNTAYSFKKVLTYPYPHPEQEGKGMMVFEDKDGNIWYGSSLRGVVWFQPDLDFINVFERDYASSTSLGGSAVFSFLPMPGDEMLVGTNRGLSRMNRRTIEFYNFVRNGNSGGSFPSVSVTAFERGGQTVYAASEAGLCYYDPSANRFEKYGAGDTSTKYRFYNESIHDVQRISDDELLLFNGAAARLNLRTGECRYGEERAVEDPLFGLKGISRSVHDERHHRLWMEAGKGDLFVYDYLQKKLSKIDYARDSTIDYFFSMRFDDKGNLLMGTAKGLIEYDTARKSSRTYIIPSFRKEIINIGVQGETVWLTTTSEIIRYNRANGQYQLFNLSVTLPYGNFIRHSMWTDESNNLWIGTNKGFCIVDTRRFHNDLRPQGPHLVSFSVYDKLRFFKDAYFNLDEIVLKHNENFFSFDFSSLVYHETKQYAYLLEGFDKDWKNSSKNAASYTNVPPGEYTLRLRTQDNSGSWVEGKSVRLVIRPPFWQTWWFISLMALILGFLLVLWYRLLLDRRRKKRIDNTIDYFANSQYGSNSVNEICWDIARNCISQLELEDCVVYLVDEKKNVLIQKAAYGPKNPKEHDIINPIEIGMGKGIVGAAAQSAKAVLVKDTSRDSRYIVDDEQRLSELAVPIVHEGKAIGVIDTEHPKRNYFTEDHVKALTTIAAICSNKIAEAKAEEAAKQSGMQLLEIKKLLAESQLMALRAQMNPHFVFNCLNSIQECIVTQKYGEASLYLNKFSKLFRSVLNNSGRVLITLQEEIEVLDLYLALEYMRFEKSFRFTIHIEEDMETDEILVPAMLLQPYVENALWHGLMHKTGDRQLYIGFKKLNDDVFECEIDDNGIGRKKALELKEQQSKTKRHVSKGMSISKDRIDILQKQGQHASLHIIDKYDDNGEATGTKVIIQLSTYLKASI